MAEHCYFVPFMPVSFMLISVQKPFMLSVTIVNAHILSVIMLSDGAINTFKIANNSVH
jgi:hypothetical protein